MGATRFTEAVMAPAAEPSVAARRMVLRAGPVTLCFEPELAFVRYVRLGDREILRGVYAAVRDERWGTVPTEVSGLEVEDRGVSFSATFDVACRAGNIDFTWRGRLEGDQTGTVRYVLDGVAHSDFLAVRIGFCVLHPVRECAGTPCAVEKTSGAVEHSIFPALVAPHQLFLEVTMLSHEVLPGVSAEVRCEGDVFETEDQRNWGDGSFKTYCRPLALSAAYQVHAGDTLHQTVTLSLRGGVQAWPGAPEAPQELVSFDVNATHAMPLPKVGLQLATATTELSPGQMTRLRALGLRHLRVDLALRQPSWSALLLAATGQALALGTALEVAVSLGPDPASELVELLAVANRLRPPVCRWLLFEAGRTPAAEVLVVARRLLAQYSPAAPLFGGSDVYFAELNRNRPRVEDVDGVCYPLTPQVHAFDNATMAEGLPAIAAQLATARSFASTLPIAVTPVTLRPRPGKGGGGPPPSPRLPPGADPRQTTLFAAGWTLGSYKYLAQGGADAITYYETTGARGVMDGDAVFPVYHVLAELHDWAGGAVIEAVSGDPLAVEGLALSKAGRRCALLANLTLSTQSVALRGVGPRVAVCCLDMTTVDCALANPESYRASPGDLTEAQDGVLVLKLAPHGIVRILQSERRSVA